MAAAVSISLLFRSEPRSHRPPSPFKFPWPGGCLTQTAAGSERPSHHWEDPRSRRPRAQRTAERPSELQKKGRRAATGRLCGSALRAGSAGRLCGPLLRAGSADGLCGPALRACSAGRARGGVCEWKPPFRRLPASCRPAGPGWRDARIHRNSGQTLVKHRPNTGQTLVKHWSNTGQTLVKHWQNTGQTLVKHWSNTVRFERLPPGINAGPEVRAGFQLASDGRRAPFCRRSGRRFQCSRPGAFFRPAEI
jgi:hypothetical protein